MSSNNITLLEMFPKQQEYTSAVFSGKYRYLMYGGAIKGGKSVTCLAVLFILCKVFPKSRWAIVRKDLTRIKRNVLPVFEKIKPQSFIGQVNRSTWEVPCSNGSVILFVSENYERDRDLDKFKGLDVNGFLLEEANELNENTFYKAIERAGSWVINGGEQPPPLILLNTNPADNWVYKLFYDPFQKGALKAPYFYLPASPFDNPHNSPAYLESLKSLPDQIYQRFVMGDWSALEEPDQVISFQWIKNAIDAPQIPGKKKLGVDVARFGDDKTVFAYMVGHTLEDLAAYSGLSIDRTADISQCHISDHRIDANLVGVDSVGLGAGVVDILKRQGYRVREIIAGAKPLVLKEYQQFKFYNLRSQMWWHGREMLRRGKLSIKLDRLESELTEDLTAPRYKISSDKTIKVESKDELKKRIGRSTDYADAFLHALFVDQLKARVLGGVASF